jgi:hypothetical protein
MTEGDDPRDPSTAAGMSQPWPIVDKHSTYEYPPAYSRAPQSPPSYGGPPPGGPRKGGGARWLVVALVVALLVVLLLWLVLG